jgi:hypothetical protein
MKKFLTDLSIALFFVPGVIFCLAFLVVFLSLLWPLLSIWVFLDRRKLGVSNEDREFNSDL